MNPNDSTSYADFDTNMIGGYNINGDKTAQRGSFVPIAVEGARLALALGCLATGEFTIGLGCIALDYGIAWAGDALANYLSPTTSPTTACGLTALNVHSDMSATAETGCLKMGTWDDSGLTNWNGDVDAALFDNLYWFVKRDGIQHRLQIEFQAQFDFWTDTVDVVLGTNIQGQVSFVDSFEKNAWTGGTSPSDAGWLYWNINGLWHMMAAPSESSLSGYSDHAMQYGPTTSGARNTGVAVSPLLNVLAATNEYLSFGSYWDTRTGTTTDQKLIEASTDGYTWQVLLQVSDATDPSRIWKYHSLSLAVYVGKQIFIRFRFDSVDTGVSGYAGWIVDDIHIGPTENVVASISPTSQKLVEGYYCTPTASFTASATGGTGYTYLWDFGDGTTGSGATVQHTYPKTQASYTVKLTVFDAAFYGGSGTASVTVTTDRSCNR